MEPEIFYFHGMTIESPYRNFTVAGTFITDTLVPQLVLGISICSENDQFNKKKGRLIATNRVLNQKDECPGRIYITLDETQKELYGYPTDFRAETLKTFICVVCRYKNYFRDELMLLFGLSNHNKK